MARYRFLAAGVLDGQIRDELPLENVSFRDELGGLGPGQLDASLQWRHPKNTRAVLLPGNSALYVERDGAIVWGGWVRWRRRDEGSRYLVVHARGFLDYFDYRHIRSTRSYQQVDQLAIARDLVLWGQGQGSTDHGTTGSGPDLGIEVGSETSGVLRDRPYRAFERKNLGEAIRQLSEVVDGFDYAVDCSWDVKDVSVRKRFRAHYPRRGRRTQHVFGLGPSGPGNVVDYSWSQDATRQATTVDGIGAGEGSSMLIVIAADPGLSSTYPLVTRTVTHKDVSEHSTLVGHAQAELQARRLPVEIVGLTVRADAIPRFSSYITGDEVEVRITDGPLDLSRRQRIAAYTVSVDGDGRESVRVEFVDPAATGV